MDFADYLRDCIARAGMSQAGLGRAVGMPGPHINMICKRKATPPLDKIDEMAAALGVSGDDAAAFRRLALLAHAPAEVSRLVEDLERQLAHRREQVVQLVAELRRRSVKLPESCRDL